MSREMASSGTATATAAATNPNLFGQKIRSFWNQYPGAVMMETLRLLPDGLLLGSGLFAFITQNFAYGMFFLIIVESLFINIGLNKVFSFLDLSRTSFTKGVKEEACRSGFQSPTADGLANMFELGGISGFPSTHVLILSSALSYVLSAMLELKNELSVLGEEYSIRFYLGCIFSFLLFLIILFYRYSNDCEGIGVLGGSILLGGLLGVALMYQNLTLFGRESINIMNIPLFKNRDINGKPIYICPTSK